MAPGQMGAHYDGIYWDPPEHERHNWCLFIRTVFPHKFEISLFWNVNAAD